MKKEDAVFLNKEIGWLRFNERVLSQVARDDVPLLERVHFSNIFNSNLDEFFMKRVSRLLHKERGARKKDLASSIEYEKEIQELLEESGRLVALNAQMLSNQIIPALNENDISLLSWKELNGEEKKWVKSFFKDKVFPVLTPMAVDKGHPFPLISNLTFSLAVELKEPGRKGKLFARIKIPELFPTWITLPRPTGQKSFRFISMFDVVSKHMSLLFPDMEIISTLPFQVTRGLDIGEQDEEDAEDLLELIAEEIKLRRFADVVRLEVPKGGSKWLLKFLCEELEIDSSRVFESELPLEMKRLDSIAKLKLSDLKYSPHIPMVADAFKRTEGSIFKVIRRKDVLVHHPTLP